MPSDVLVHQPTIDVFSLSRPGAARIRLRVPLATRLFIIVSGVPALPELMTRAAPLRNVMATTASVTPSPFRSAVDSVMLVRVPFCRCRVRASRSLIRVLRVICCGVLLSTSIIAMATPPPAVRPTTTISSESSLTATCGVPVMPLIVMDISTAPVLLSTARNSYPRGVLAATTISALPSSSRSPIVRSMGPENRLPKGRITVSVSSPPHALNDRIRRSPPVCSTTISMKPSLSRSATSTIESAAALEKT